MTPKSTDVVTKLSYNNSSMFQDLPEYFEDNMEIWMSNFHTLLTTDVPALRSTVKNTSNSISVKLFIDI